MCENSNCLFLTKEWNIYWKETVLLSLIYMYFYIETTMYTKSVKTNPTFLHCGVVEASTQGRFMLHFEKNNVLQIYKNYPTT